MPARLHPIDRFVRDFGKWFRADRIDVLGDMRARLQVMLDEAEQRGIDRERAAPNGHPLVCAKCGSSAWTQVSTSTAPMLPRDGRERAEAFIRSLDTEAD